MDRDEFWRHIEQARDRNSEVPDDGLRGELQALPVDELVSFQAHFDELFDSAYRWDLWGAAYLIEGGCSDDGFIDFRYGLISHGRSAFEAALADPDSLAAITGLESDESYGYVAITLIEEKGRNAQESRVRGPSDPAGEDWDFDDADQMRRRYPRLWARHGW